MAAYLVATPSTDGRRLCGADRHVRCRLFHNAPAARRPDVPERLAPFDGKWRSEFPQELPLHLEQRSVRAGRRLHNRIYAHRHGPAYRTGPRSGPSGPGARAMGGHAAHSNPAARITWSGGGIAAVLGFLFALNRADQSNPRAAGTDPRPHLISWNVPERAAVHELPDRLEILWSVHAYLPCRAAGYSRRSL